MALDGCGDATRSRRPHASSQRVWSVCMSGRRPASCSVRRTVVKSTCAVRSRAPGSSSHAGVSVLSCGAVTLLDPWPGKTRGPGSAWCLA